MKRVITLMAAVLVAVTALLVTAAPVLACTRGTELSLSASATEVSPGGIVTLDIYEENTGEEDLLNVSVLLSADDGSAPETLTCASPSFDAASETDDPTVLDVVEVWHWQVTRTVNVTTTFTAVGTAFCSHGLEVTYPDYPERDQVTVTVQGGGEGCTPGYWKNNAIKWGAVSWVGYTPSQTLESVFDVPDSLGLDSKTLLQGLQFQGGRGVSGASQILLRSAVAAVLNAANPNVDYAMSALQIIADVNSALASGDRDEMLTLAGELDGFNNDGCSIDMHGNPILVAV